MDSSTVRYCPVVAIWTPEVQSAVTMYGEWPEPMRMSSGKRHELRPAGFPVAVVDASPGHVQCRSARRRGIRSGMFGNIF